MSEIPYTAEQLEQGIANAIAAREFDAVEPLLRLLVVVDPHAASRVWDEIQLGLALKRTAAGERRERAK